MSLCKEYIQEHHVTHYVSGLIIGAAFEEHLDEAISSFHANAGGNLKGDTLPAQASAEAGIQSDRRTGFMKTVATGELNATCTPGMYDIVTPAVLAHILHPVAKLLRKAVLREAFETALTQYIDHETDRNSCKWIIYKNEKAHWWHVVIYSMITVILVYFLE